MGVWLDLHHGRDNPVAQDLGCVDSSNTILLSGYPDCCFFVFIILKDGTSSMRIPKSPSKIHLVNIDSQNKPKCPQHQGPNQPHHQTNFPPRSYSLAPHQRILQSPEPYRSNQHNHDTHADECCRQRLPYLVEAKMRMRMGTMLQPEKLGDNHTRYYEEE